MFSFCDVILHDKSIIRGGFLHHKPENSIYIFSRNPVVNIALKTEGSVTEIPCSQIQHIRFFSTVYLFERISAIPLLNVEQRGYFVQELYRFMRERGLVGIEHLLERITMEEMMILLTEVEHDKYVVVNGQVLRYIDDQTYPIDFKNPVCLSKLITFYMEAWSNMEQKAKSIEADLQEYRQVYYHMSYEDIMKLKSDT
ncbi:hypothetical protein [Paenibacillus polymyxa]|uniref:Uncharacterized protein n=1 Tax=Paenibacillus polymyxa (strain SC2) TaxID=886882 RepID=E3EL91_PAEPS|nr:hypothetical protein [Paenibacillus polymyxa]ADO59923.1 hypothetical protein PPSC2_28555 [Paenibacillus polymyxa SC2]WPQ59853.1 hypothetical protein SKN87_26565 [Paenibacillus polymyxa]